MPQVSVPFEGGNVRRGLITLAALAALVIPASASAKVKLVSITSPAFRGSYATLTVALSRPATCRIIVMYKSGSSHAGGLDPKRSVRGRVWWTWMVGTNTTGGRWPIFVYCGGAGALQTSFVVR
jgi:micrococcal nuclease